MTTGADVLNARAVGWSTSERYVLLDCSLGLRAGEWVAITGSNGAGKTTLLDLLSGQRSPSEGVVELHGVPLNEVAPEELGRRIAVLNHKVGLYMDLTGRENVTLFAALAGNPDGDVEELLRRVELPQSAWDKPVRFYSRGMQQRTALARMLGTCADVWLMDEPSTGLDERGRALMMAVLTEARDKGVAVLTITHNEQLSAAADVHLCLRDGALAPKGAK